MVGHLVLAERGRPVALEQENVAGATLLRAAVAAPREAGEEYLLRRVNKAVRLLKRAGCRRVLAPMGCPWWPVLRAHGLAAVDPEPLVQAMAAPLTLAALRRLGGRVEDAVVALCGRRVSRPMFETAEALCPLVRRLAVVAPEGGDALANHLRGEFGLPILGEREARQAQVTVCFSPGWEERQGRALRLWGETPDLGGLELSCRVELPVAAEERLALMALLWERGEIVTADILAN